MNFNQIQIGGPNDCPPVTTTTSSSTYPIETPSVSEKGWECPRCGRINAPWVRQCDCSPSTTSTWGTITVNPYDELWNTSDTFKIHPESTIYTTNVNQVVGGSGYKGSIDYEEFLRQQLNYNYKFNNKNEDE